MKLLIKEIIEDKNNKWNIIKTMFAPKQMCKTCGAKVRREGSSYCEECANMYNRNNDKDAIDVLKVGTKTNYT